MHRKKHTSALENQPLVMDVDNKGSLAINKVQTLTVNAILPAKSKLDDQNSRPETAKLDNVQQSLEKLVFYKCQYCTYFTMKSDLMDNHMEQPPDECEAAKSEKQMKQQQTSANRKRLLDQKKSRIELHLSAYKTTRMRTIKPSVSKKKNNCVSRSKKVKSDLMDNRLMKKRPYQRRMQPRPEEQLESEQGTSTKPRDLKKSLKGKNRTRYQSGLAGKLEKKHAKSDRPLGRKRFQTGVPTEMPNPLPVVQLQPGKTDPPILAKAEEAQDAVETYSDLETSTFAPELMEVCMITESDESQKAVEVSDPETSILTPDLMEVHMMTEEMNEVDTLPVLQLQQRKMPTPILTQEKEVQETVKVNDTDTSISPPYLIEVDMMTDEETDAVDPIPVLELQQQKMELHIPTQEIEVQETVEINDPDIPISASTDLIQENMTSEGEEAQETVKAYTDPEMPIPTPVDLLEGNLMTEAKETRKTVEVSNPEIALPALADHMEGNTVTEAKEAHKTVEVSNSEMAFPIPADHMDGNMMTEVEEARETVKIGNTEVAILPPKNILKGSMMMEEMDVVNRPPTPVSFMSPLELLSLITGKTPAEEAREILRVKGSEISHENDICKLRLNFLRIDFISLKLGYLVTHEVDQSEMDLVEEKALSMKTRIDELEDQLTTFRKIEESISYKLKEVQ